MWPLKLDLTRDECRGLLRRMELESYSTIISTFRAQGILNEAKTKVLQDLRILFNISQDRHKAEMRRAANDEKLCSISEKLSGACFIQEWNTESRRSYPLIARAVPCSALLATANEAVEKISNENNKMAVPSTVQRELNLEELQKDTYLALLRKKAVVSEDVSLATLDKSKNLKRALSYTDHLSMPVIKSKKRSKSRGKRENVLNLIHPNKKIQQLYQNHSKTHKIHKRSSMKKSSIGHKSKMYQSEMKMKNSKHVKRSNLEGEMQIWQTPKKLHTYPDIIQGGSRDSKTLLETYTKTNIEIDNNTPENLPQIATSKKDITNNLSKLNLVPATQTQPSNLQCNDKHLNSKILFTNKCDTNKILISPKIISNPDKLINQKANVIVDSIAKGGKPKIKIQPYNTKEKQIIANIEEFKERNINNEDVCQEKQYSESSSNIMFSNETTELSNNEKCLIQLDDAKLRSSQVFSLNQSPQSTKQKIQITNQQVINPAGSNIRLPPGMHLKAVQNNRNIKIISSTSGKMFIQSRDSLKSLPKLGTLPIAKGSLTNSVSPLSTGNRVALQKLQLMPALASKTVSVNKPNIVVVQANTNIIPTNRNIFLKNLSVPKSSKLEDRSSESSNNVIVLGSLSSEKNIKKEENLNLDKNFSESNVITEDTPVDILTMSSESFDQSKTQTATKLQDSILTSKIKQTSKSFQANQKTLKRPKTTNYIENKYYAKAQTTIPDSNFVINTTDWEAELDQEANKTKQKTGNYLNTINLESNVKEGRENTTATSTITLNSFNNVTDDKVILNDVQPPKYSIKGTPCKLNTYENLQDNGDNISIEYIKPAAGSSKELNDKYEKPNLPTIDKKTRRPHENSYIVGNKPVPGVSFANTLLLNSMEKNDIESRISGSTVGLILNGQNFGGTHSGRSNH